MGDVSKFNLDGTDINVKDSTARSDVTLLSTTVSNLSSEVAALEQLSRLTVAYDSTTEKITFTNTTHVTT